MILKSVQHSITHLLRSIGGGAEEYAGVALQCDAAILRCVRRWVPFNELEDRWGQVKLRRLSSIVNGLLGRRVLYRSVVDSALFPIPEAPWSDIQNQPRKFRCGDGWGSPIAREGNKLLLVVYI